MLNRLLPEKHKDTIRRCCSSTQLYGRLTHKQFEPLVDYRRFQKNLFIDHADYPESICWHPNQAISMETAHLATACSITMNTIPGDMYITQGHPCENPYNMIRLKIDENLTNPEKL